MTDRGLSTGHVLASPPTSPHPSQNETLGQDHNPPSRPEYEYTEDFSSHQLLSIHAEQSGLGALSDSVNMSSPTMIGIDSSPTSPLVTSSSSRRPLSSLVPITRPSSSAIVNNQNHNHVINSHLGGNITPGGERTVRIKCRARCARNITL